MINRHACRYGGIRFVLLLGINSLFPAILPGQTCAPAVTGWRGDGSGRYPLARPPVEWGRVSPALAKIAWQADRPKDGNPAGASLADGMVRRWLVLGPLERQAPGQEEADSAMARSQPAEGDKLESLAWKAADTEAAFLNFNSHRGRSRTASAFAHAYLHAPQPTTIVLCLLHSSDTCVWLNGKQVYRRAPGQATSGTIKLALDKGWNRLLIRVAPGKGWFDKENWFLNAVFFPVESPQTPSNVAWQRPLGGGAAPIVVGDRLLLQAEPFDLVCLDKHTGRILWVRSNHYYHATPEAQRQGEAFQQAGRLAADLDQINRSLAPGGPTSEQERRKAGLQKQLYEQMRQIDPAKYSFTKEQDLGVAGFVPVSDGRHVWAWFASGIACCYDLDGTRRWIALDNRAGQHHGFATSPLLLEGKLIAYMHELLAFDAATGAAAWVEPICRNPASQWSAAFQGSLCALESGGAKLFMTPAGSVRGAADGKERFADARLARTFQAPTPVAQGDTVCTLNNDGVLHILKFSSGFEKLNSHRTVKFDTTPYRMFFLDWYMASPLVHDGLVYSLNVSGLLTVVDIRTAEIIYQKLLDFDAFDGWGLLRPSLCLAGGRIYALGPTGTCLVLKPGRKFAQLAKNRLGAVSALRPERFTATPVFDDDRVYLRGEHSLFCVQSQ
jgi:outer membrane protein assembly factor BamB